MLKYVGRGNFRQGVPARDLTEAEAKRYGGRERLVASGLYVAGSVKRKTKPKPREEE